MALQISGYRIIRKINQGGMSTVYLAIQISVGRVVALKVMNPSLNKDPAFSERFQREATIVGQLSHPNIVAIYDIGREDDFNYIAMDYLPGGSAHDKMITGLKADEVLRITKEIASALAHAHEKGYIHRDIKPDNILFRADNSAVLSDFGVAKGVVGVSRMTHVGTIVGTPHYMSPEQARGQTVDERSDLYSLGVVFYEMLTGSLPYQGEDAVAIALKHIGAPIPHLPLQFHAYQKILDTFLAKDPEQRFQNGHDIIDAIELVEANTRTAHITTSASESLSVFALFNALIGATHNAFKWRWNKLKNRRWSKERGFFQHASAENSIFSDEVSSTIIATRIEQAANIDRFTTLHYQPPLKKILGFIAAMSILWCTFSLLTYKKYTLKTASETSTWQKVILSTAGMFVKLPEKVITQKTNNSNTSKLTRSSQVSSSLLTSSSTANSSENSVHSSSIASESSSLASSASSASSTYALTIKTTPDKARIRLLDVPDKYIDGIALKSGRYRVEISKQGYNTKTDTLEIKNQALTIHYELTEIQATATDDTSNSNVADATNSQKIPAMVRIAAGSFMMGDNNNPQASPAHKVTISKAFYISKYEVTFAEYDQYVKATNRALPGDNNWGRDNRPVVHVNWNDARAYTEWLSKITGKKYRLPTEAEWEYVARAGSKTRFWWGENEEDAKYQANCRRGCVSSYSGLFGSKTAPVGIYPANAFGVYDTAGNVAEWVEDCYKSNYEKTPTNGSAAQEKDCKAHVVRGGSAKNNLQSLESSARENHFPTFYDDTLGFRVVME